MTKYKLRAILFFAISLFFINDTFSQEDNNSDFETWSSIGFNYKTKGKWDFGIEEQLRLKDNSSVIDGYFTELSTKFDPFKHFEFGAGIRFIRKNDTKGKKQGYENHFRFHLDAYFKEKWSRLSFKTRLRYQNRDELGVSNAEGDYAKQNLRLKVGLDYDIKKWKLDPEISAEIFYYFEHEQVNQFSKYRVTIGTDYKIKKAGKIGLFYRFEQELNTLNPQKTNILRIKYVYTLKQK